MMESNDSVTGPINLGNPVEQTIKELSSQIVAMVGSKSKIIFKDIPQDDPKRRKPDISEATQKLNWTPTKNIEVGLKETISYFRSKL